MIREAPHRSLTTVGQRPVSALPHPEGVPNHPSSPTPAGAADLHRQGVRRLVDGNAAAAACAFRRAIDADAGFALGHAGLAAALDELRPGTGRSAEVDDLLGLARHTVRGRSRRERQHVAIVELGLDGRLARASALAREHLAEFPDDELVLHVVARRCADLDDLLP
jgi:hypothetical protein